MSDDTQETQTDGEETQRSEIDLLKERADLMGISYHPSIGPEKLKAKIEERMAQNEPKPQAEPAPAPQTSAPKVAVKPMSLRESQLHDAKQLKSVRITCMNPNKREYTGEIFTFGNRSIKTFRKFVPFNVPWMLPVFMINMIKSKKVQLFRTVNRNGQKVREGYLIPEFAIEELPGPSPAELERLATKQAAQQALDDN